MPVLRRRHFRLARWPSAGLSKARGEGGFDPASCCLNHRPINRNRAAAAGEAWYHEVRVRQSVIRSFREEGPIAPVEVAFRRQTLGEQDVVLIEFNVLVGHRDDRHASDRRAVDQA